MKAKRLSILHVGNHTIPCIGGIENVIWESSKEQLRAGNGVEIVVFNTCTKGTTLPAYEEKEGVKIHRVPQKGFSFYRVPPLPEFLQYAQGKDIVHVHGFGGWLEAACRTKKKHSALIVLNTHGGFRHTTERSILKWVYQTFFLPSLLKKVDGIICDSPSDQTFVENFSYKTKIIPNGISSEFFAQAKTKKDKNQWLFVGRLSRNKRVDRLLETLAHYPSFQKITLHIVGDNWEGLQKGLEQRAKELGIDSRVRFHGKVSDETRMKLFAKCGIFLSASEYEGFGISAIEATAAGCIPVLNCIPSFEHFASQTKGIIITDFSNPINAAKDIQKVMDARASSIQFMKNELRAFAAEYDWKIIVGNQLEYYRRLSP
ncbi:MAG: glycosyltransferase [archaeon]